MADITIYHNPRCSKSRETLGILTDAKVSPVVIEYLKDTPDVETLKSLIAKLGRRPIDIVRTGESMFKELGLHEGEPTDDQLLKAMVAHPILIQRPIVVRGDRAVMGRPPENVRSLL